MRNKQIRVKLETSDGIKNVFLKSQVNKLHILTGCASNARLHILSFHAKFNFCSIELSEIKRT